MRLLNSAVKGVQTPKRKRFHVRRVTVSPMNSYTSLRHTGGRLSFVMAGARGSSVASMSSRWMMY